LPRVKPPPLFISLTLGFWLGIHALRSYVPAAVWNLADELPLSLKPVLAVGTHALGLVGVLLVLKWRRRTLHPLVLAFAGASLARQMLTASDQIGPWVSLLGWILWLWFMASLADEVARQDAEPLIAPAFAAAVALQMGLQSAWHGLDLASVRGPVAVLVSAALIVLLAASVFAARPPALPRPHASLAWLLIGPALFLEVTFVGNAGRISEATGLALLAATILMQAVLLLSVVIAARLTGFGWRVAFIAIGFLAVFTIAEWRLASSLVLPAVQVVVICALTEAADRRLRLSGAAAFTLGALLLFGLIFAFYNFYELPALWLLCLAALAVPAALAKRARAVPAPYIVPLVAGSAALALLYLVPPPEPNAVPDGRDLTVLSYNIHHGFDDAGVPGMQATANAIAAMNPDLVALQEVSRGWTLVGGNDLVAYLKWRLPDYQIFFTATNGRLWGNAIMTRLPARDVAGGVFAAEPRILKYGWTRVVIEDGRLRFPIYSVHLTADLEGAHGDPRTAQAAELLQLIGNTAPVLVAGDFNAHPEDAPIRLLTAGLADLGAATGLGALATWPAGAPNERIDYIFARGFAASRGSIPRTLASDHLPVLLQVQPQAR
jgi:endonuclease/exonuclease/phosphatase family metal-dependent hydrolase